MGPIKEDTSKRKANEDPATPSANKRIKSSHSDSPEHPKKIPVAGNPIPFPEKVS
jgi:histone acetyltransferase